MTEPDTHTHRWDWQRGREPAFRWRCLVCGAWHCDLCAGRPLFDRSGGAS